MTVSGYALSARAAEAETRYSRGRVVPLEAKAAAYATRALSLSDPSGWAYEAPAIGGGERITPDLMIGLSTTWACVSFWAGNIASLPVAVQRKGPGGIYVDASDHPLYWLLHDSPNYDQSAFDFWEYAVGCLELHGNAYAEMKRRGDGFLISLNPIRPDTMVVSRVNGILTYRWPEDGQQREETQENILHIRGFGGGPLGGLSPLATCRGSFANVLSAERAAAAIFSNGARPSGVLTKDGQPLTVDQKQQLEELLAAKWIGAMNAGRPMLLDGGLKWEALEINAADAEMLATRRFGVEDICRIFEVDPHLVGQTQGNTALGSSIVDQTQSLLKFKLRKRLKRIEGALEKQLLTRVERRSGLSIKFNIEAFLRADSLGRANYYNIMRQFMTVNEIRALEGLPPIDGGDQLMVQMQDVPIGQAAAPQKEPAR